MAKRKAALLMILYAVVLVAMGVAAFLLAPEGANAKTALISSSGSAFLMVICAVLAMTSNRTLVMVGVHVGLLLPLVFAGTFFWRGSIGWQASGQYQYLNEVVLPREVDAGRYENTAEGRDAFFADKAYEIARAEGEVSAELAEKDAFIAKAIENNDLPNHDKAYVGRLLMLLFGTSLAFFVAILTQRPKPEAREPREERDDHETALSD